jgi:hypothetical protein
MASGMKQLNDPFRFIARDDKLWAKELSWAQQHGMIKMRCPCNKCEGKGRPILVDTIRRHLILNGRHSLYKIWKGPREINDSDQEWVVTNKGSL